MKRICILLFALFGIGIAFLTQSVAVKGQLYCGEQPAVGVKVKLYDDDGGPNPDDNLDEKFTDDNGRFALNGSTMEISDIDPEIRIYHDCNDRGRPCQREWVIRIPSKYISPGPTAKEAMDFGRMNLEVELTNEDQDCVH